MFKFRFLIINLVLTAAFGAAVFFQSRAPNIKVGQNYLRPPENLKYFTLGYNDMIASSLWIRLIYNLDFCEGGKVQDEDYVPPLANKESVDGILQRKLKPSRCHLGWVYSMIEVISSISPTFKLAYEPGATVLSVMIDDREGARRIFDKAVQAYPKDWVLNYKAGYHYLWEIQNPQRAAELFNVAQIHGAPGWVASLSAALYTRAGQARIAKTVLEQSLKDNPNNEYADRIKARLEEVDQILHENP